MYICNRCGCSAMAEIGKKLICLNCGNEQPKALSRKRDSCIPNTPRHNQQTVKHVGVSPRQAPKPASPKPRPAWRQAAGPKSKKPLKTVISVIVGIAVLFNVVLPAAGNAGRKYASRADTQTARPSRTSCVARKQ